METRRKAALRVEIRVQGVLGAEWAGWLCGIEVGPEPEGNTTLTGSLPDQAALHGLLGRLRDMGLPILMINVKETNEEDSNGGE